MRIYDYAKLKKFIKSEAEKLEEVSLGMLEDWSWTAETVWENGKYTKQLKKDTEIAGINGSTWARPICLAKFKDGSEKRFDCWKGDKEKERPDFFSLGSISGPEQDYIYDVEKASLDN